MDQISHNPAEANHVSPQATLGGYYANAGKVYRYVQFKEIDTVTIVPGDVVQAVGGGTGIVTADISASVHATLGRVYGVAVSTPTDDYYGYVQVRGFCALISTSGDVAKGSYLVSGADKLADPYTPTTDITADPNNDAARIFGQAGAADSAANLTDAEIWCS